MKPETRLRKKQENYKLITEWLESHDNVFPREEIIVDGKPLKKSQMTKKQKFETEIAKKFKIYFNEDRKMFNGFIFQKSENIPEQYRKIVAVLRTNKPQKFKAEDKKRLQQDSRAKKKIAKAVTWLREHPGKLPELNKNPKTPEEKEESSVYRILRSQPIAEVQARYEYSKLSAVPEEYQELVRLCRAVPQDEKLFKRYVDFLKKNQRPPRSTITKNGRRLSWNELLPEELEEVRFYSKWINSRERAIADSYSDIPTNKIPGKYRRYISVMREFSGYDDIQNFFEELVEWFETHQDNLPRESVDKKEKISPKARRYERNLRKAWEESEEKQILEEYAGKPICLVPEEHREKVAILRESWLGLTESDKEDRLMSFLERNNGVLPRQNFKKDGVNIKRGELSLEQYREVRLRQFWDTSKLKEIMIAYHNELIEIVPEDYKKKIQILRDYGLDKEKKVYGNIFDEIVQWLKEHNGEFPRTIFERDPSVKGAKKKEDYKTYGELTDEEKAEVSLAQRWFRADERETVIRNSGVDLEDVPEEDKLVVKTIRENAVREPKKIKRREPLKLEELIDWLETHNNKMPREKVYVNGRAKKVDEYTPEELQERELNKDWIASFERNMYIMYYYTPLEEVPEEIREKIGILRLHKVKIKDIDRKAERIMRKTVGRHVEDNSRVRAELESELLRVQGDEEYPDFDE